MTVRPLLTVVTGPRTIPHFLAIAALDRVVWSNNPDSQFTPDGEHVWRVWAEHAFVTAVLDHTGLVVGAGVSFATSDPHTHFAHKAFIRDSWRRQGVGTLMAAAYLDFLDREGTVSLMTVDPANTASIALSDAQGYRTTELIPGFYGPAEDRLLRRRPPATR